MRGVYIKGSSTGDVLAALWKLCSFALVFNLLAVWSYQKRTS